ncbi:MAG: hypothetical protein ACMUIA_11480 [bacterium]
MNRLHERMSSALDLFLHGCRIWAEVQCDQHFLDEMESIKAEFQRISHQAHDEETVTLIENMTFRILSDLDLAMKKMGLRGLQIEGTRH